MEVEVVVIGGYVALRILKSPNLMRVMTTDEATCIAEKLIEAIQMARKSKQIGDEKTAKIVG